MANSFIVHPSETKNPTVHVTPATAMANEATSQEGVGDLGGGGASNTAPSQHGKANNEGGGSVTDTSNIYLLTHVSVDD